MGFKQSIPALRLGFHVEAELDDDGWICVDTKHLLESFR